MRITVLTHKESVQGIRNLLTTLSDREGALYECAFYDQYDDFIRAFTQDQSQVVIVARKGADGMECARSARRMRPSVPLVWLSDDGGFGVESYRIGCAYFSTEAITESLLSTAIERCRTKGEQ